MLPVTVQPESAASDAMLEEMLDNPKIPTPPAVALQVLERVGHPDCSLTEIREIIRHDPALCSLILKTLNSILYCFSHTVTSIDQALLLLGLSRVRSLVLTLYLPAIRSVTRTSPHLKNFWKSSVIGAIVARELSARIGRPDPESDLLAGLMRDMGKIVLIQLYPIEYAELLAISHEVPEGYMCDRETQRLGMNHAKVSAALLQRWRLPDPIVKAVAHHHLPEAATKLGTEVADRTALLHFASLASQFLISPHVPGLRRELLHRAMGRFGMDETRLAEFLTPLSVKVMELGTLLNVDVGHDLNYASILSNVSEELVKLTLQTSLESVRVQETKIQAEEEADQWRKAAQRLQEQTTRDPLTGLYNRSFLQDTLSLELRRHRHRFSMLGLMFIDLDGFKAINDQFGHASGDLVLKEISVVMQASFRTTDIVARLGGDEFCILLPDAAESAFKIMADRLVRAINRIELRFGRQLCSVGASVGVSYCLTYDGNCSPELLMEAADQAMYQSKLAGKNRVTLKSLLTPTDKEFKESVERRSFRAFLLRRGLVTDQQIFQTQGCRLARISLQRLARKLGWLTRQESCELTRRVRSSRKSFADLARAEGYLKPVDLWTLLAIQHEQPEALAQQIVAAGLLGSREMTEELEAYYLLMGTRAAGASSLGTPSNHATKPPAASGSHIGLHLRSASGSRYGSYLKRGDR